MGSQVFDENMKYTFCKKQEDSMEYIAHLNEERTQTLKDHLCGTACGMLHDIGKYSLAFQDKIKNNSNRQVDHSTAGAKACFEKGGMYRFMSYCIAGHHSGLPDYGSSLDPGNAPTLQGRKKKHIEDCGVYKSEIHIPEIKTLPFDPKNSSDPDFSLSVFIRMLYGRFRETPNIHCKHTALFVSLECRCRQHSRRKGV